MTTFDTEFHRNLISHVTTLTGKRKADIYQDARFVKELIDSHIATATPIVDPIVIDDACVQSLIHQSSSWKVLRLSADNVTSVLSSARPNSINELENIDLILFLFDTCAKSSLSYHSALLDRTFELRCENILDILLSKHYAGWQTTLHLADMSSYSSQLIEVLVKHKAGLWDNLTPLCSVAHTSKECWFQRNDWKNVLKLCHLRHNSIYQFFHHVIYCGSEEQLTACSKHIVDTHGSFKPIQLHWEHARTLPDAKLEYLVKFDSIKFGCFDLSTLNNHNTSHDDVHLLWFLCTRFGTQKAVHGMLPGLTLAIIQRLFSDPLADPKHTFSGTILSHAVQHDNFDIVEWMLSIDVPMSPTILSYTENEDLLMYLVMRGAKVDCIDSIHKRLQIMQWVTSWYRKGLALFFTSNDLCTFIISFLYAAFDWEQFVQR